MAFGYGGLRGQLSGAAAARQRGLAPPPKMLTAMQATRRTQPYRRPRIPGVQPPPDLRPPTMALQAMRAGRPMGLPHPLDVQRQLARQARRRGAR
jgi:hypothetical protein